MQIGTYNCLKDENLEQAAKALDLGAQMLRDGYVEVMRLIGGIRPPQLDEDGVLAAIERFVAEFKIRNKVKVEFNSNVAQLKLTALLENTVFRIVQECVTNACRYSKSKKVKVELTQHDDQLRIEVQDWVVGFKAHGGGEGQFGLEAIDADGRNAAAWLNRGWAWGELGEYDKSIADFNHALMISPNEAILYYNRGITYAKNGDYDKSIADFNHALMIDPNHAEACNCVAWLYATCPTEKCRDGKKAVEKATKAHQLSGGKSWNYIATLAAAYAESGDFAKAVEWQAKAITIVPDEKSKQRLLARLELYKQGKPFREEPIMKLR